MIIINPNDKTSVYYPLFFGEGNNMDTYKTSGAGYIVASLLEVTSNRDGFTDITLTNASPNLPTITPGGYDVITSYSIHYTKLYDRILHRAS